MKRKPNRETTRQTVPPSLSTERSVVMADAFRDDLLFWSRSDPRMVTRILELVESIRRDPFNGRGKPEPLKHEMSGHWSRRINGEHRLVYQVLAGQINLVSARFHYPR